MRPSPRLLLGCAAIAVIVGTAACGSSSSPPTATSTALRVTLEPRGASGPQTTWSVACPSSTHAAACARLLASPDAFTPVPPDSACTMIYGGPQVLRVEGTIGARRIAYSTGRTNGCEIAAYERDLALVAPFRPSI